MSNITDVQEIPKECIDAFLVAGKFEGAGWDVRVESAGESVLSLEGDDIASYDGFIVRIININNTVLIDSLMESLGLPFQLRSSLYNTGDFFTIGSEVFYPLPAEIDITNRKMLQVDAKQVINELEEETFKFDVINLYYIRNLISYLIWSGCLSDSTISNVLDKLMFYAKRAPTYSWASIFNTMVVLPDSITSFESKVQKIISLYFKRGGKERDYCLTLLAGILERFPLLKKKYYSSRINRAVNNSEALIGEALSYFFKKQEFNSGAFSVRARKANDRVVLLRDGIKIASYDGDALLICPEEIVENESFFDGIKSALAGMGISRLPFLLKGGFSYIHPIEHPYPLKVDMKAKAVVNKLHRQPYIWHFECECGWFKKFEVLTFMKREGMKVPVNIKEEVFKKSLNALNTIKAVSDFSIYKNTLDAIAPFNAAHKKEIGRVLATRLKNYNKLSMGALKRIEEIAIGIGLPELVGPYLVARCMLGDKGQ